jgi:hypothetical protein
MRPKIAAVPTTAPTPIPALAPVDRPLEGEGGTMIPCVGRLVWEVVAMLVPSRLIDREIEVEEAVDTREVGIESGVNVAASWETS